MTTKEPQPPIVYRYTNEQNQPLLVCPFCSEPLDQPGSINLELTVCNQPINVMTHLDENGYLIDTEDSAIAAGFHSSTNCRYCGEALYEYESD